jgi:hypothetical protein
MRSLTAIEPIYRTTSTNSPVELGTHRITLLCGDQRGPEGDAVFSLRLSPSPRLVCSMQIPTHLPTGNVITGADIPALSTRFPTLPPDVTVSSAGTHIALHPNPDRIEVFRTKLNKLREVIFHVINFYDFHQGKSDLIVATGTSVRRLGRILLESAGWRVTIHALPETEHFVRSLRSEGGYAITHVGKIERARRGSFAVSQAKTLLDILRLYLSFARGSFVSCSLAVGSDGSGISWEQWGSPIIYPWRYYSGSFSGEPANLLEEAFPGFLALFKDANWRRPAREVIYWYLRANNTSEGAGVDGGIILAQAALEKLSWVYLVDDVQTVTAAGFKSWRTAKKISELLSRMNIPSDIPSELGKLNRIASQYGWADGPTALAEIRNDLVHAEQKYMRGRDSPFADAWLLAQRYIELAILRIARYSGRYTDRISAKWVGETTKVPWA